MPEFKPRLNPLLGHEPENYNYLNPPPSVVLGIPRNTLIMLWALLTFFQIYATMAKVDPVSIDVTQRFGYAPLTVTGKVVIPQSEENRGYCIQWESEEGQSGQSCKPIDGIRAPKTFNFEIKALPAGYYNVFAAVLRPSGYILSQIRTVEVIPKF